MVLYMQGDVAYMYGNAEWSHHGVHGGVVQPDVVLSGVYLRLVISVC